MRVCAVRCVERQEAKTRHHRRGLLVQHMSLARGEFARRSRAERELSECARSLVRGSSGGGEWRGKWRGSLRSRKRRSCSPLVNSSPASAPCEHDAHDEAAGRRVPRSRGERLAADRRRAADTWATGHPSMLRARLRRAACLPRSAELLLGRRQYDATQCDETVVLEHAQRLGGQSLRRRSWQRPPAATRPSTRSCRSRRHHRQHRLERAERDGGSSARAAGQRAGDGCGRAIRSSASS